MNRHERIAKLGQLGETGLAPDWLAKEGFSVTNLNLARRNQPFADLLLVRGDERYFTSVKTRNKNRDDGVTLNNNFNLTTFSLERVFALALEHEAIPAWVAVPVRADCGRFSAFFGLVSELPNHHYISMSESACRTYHCVADDEPDERITPDLHNGPVLGSTLPEFPERRSGRRSSAASGAASSAHALRHT